MSYTSPHVAVVVAGLTELEQSFQRLDSNDARAQLVRDARQTICQLDGAAQDLLRWKDEALVVLGAWAEVWVAAGQPGPLGRSMAENTVDEITRLRSTIDALNIELSRRPNLAVNRPWSFDEAGTSYVDDWGPDRSHLDADLAGDQIANIIYDNGAGEDIDGDGDAWGIVTEYLDGALNLVNEARHRFPELDEWLTREGRWPQRREAREADASSPLSAAALDGSSSVEAEVKLQATWDDDGGGWWFDHDDDPETDFERYNSMAAVQVPRHLWDRYLWLRDAWNGAALAVCDAAGLERNEGGRTEVCATPTGDTHCRNCGYSLDIHEDISRR